MPDEPGELVVDMRSAAYAAAWKPQRATLLAVRAFTESGGKRKPVSHMAKAVRGEVAAGAAARRRSPPNDPRPRPRSPSAAGFEVELAGGNLDVIVTAEADGRLPSGAASSRGRRGRAAAGSATSTSPSAAIVSRLERSISLGCVRPGGEDDGGDLEARRRGRPRSSAACG